jgi:hypothetical protein
MDEIGFAPPARTGSRAQFIGVQSRHVAVRPRRVIHVVEVRRIACFLQRLAS